MSEGNNIDPKSVLREKFGGVRRFKDPVSSLRLNNEGNIVYDSKSLRLSRPAKKMSRSDWSKPRIEKTTEKTISRLRESISQSRTDSEMYNEHIGLTHGQDGRFMLSLTDGYRALLVPTLHPLSISKVNFTETALNPLAEVLLTDPELYRIVKQASVAADTRSFAIRISVSKSNNSDGKITITSSSDEIRFEGEVNCQYLDGPQLEICLNWRYLEPVLGNWPLRMFTKPSSRDKSIESIAIFAPLDNSFRYAIRPMRA